MWKQSVLKKVIRPKRRQIKIVVQIKANFNQTIFPQSIFIFNLWKFEQEDARSNAIHKLFLLLLVFPSFILCAALLLDLDNDHAATRFFEIKIKKWSPKSSARSCLFAWLPQMQTKWRQYKRHLCVLLPCQQNWCLWCRPPCGAGQWSCWPSWGGSAVKKLKMGNAECFGF